MCTSQSPFCNLTEKLVTITELLSTILETQINVGAGPVERGERQEEIPGPPALMGARAQCRVNPWRAPRLRASNNNTSEYVLIYLHVICIIGLGGPLLVLVGPKLQPSQPYG